MTQPLSEYERVYIYSVQSHTGIESNELADKLAKADSRKGIVSRKHSGNTSRELQNRENYVLNLQSLYYL